MKPTVTLRWRTFGFGLMLGLGLLLAIMPDNLARGSAGPIAGNSAATPDGFAIPPATLAAWLEEGQPVGLIDARERWEYDEFHLEGARHLPAEAAAGAEGASIEGSPVVVIARDDAGAGYVVDALRRNGVDAWALAGGLEAFWDTVLRPASLDTSISPERLAEEAARRAAWRTRFLGAGAGEPASVTPAPAPAPIAVPVAPVPGASTKGRRGKGC